MTHAFRWWCLLALVGCGASLSDAQVKSLRSELRAAIGEPVRTLDERDAHSRVLADVVGRGVVEGMTQLEIRTTFGQGRPCRVALCSEHGFTDADWYYEIGLAEGDKVKQLPVMIVGFDPRGRAVRVWTLTTHP